MGNFQYNNDETSFIFWKTREGLLCKDFTGTPVNTSVKGDKIYVLDNGNIVQSGTHKELEREEGHYMEFLKNQLI